ncbi:hypothetical protein OROGR_015328 [Orobanche gracilis]
MAASLSRHSNVASRHSALIARHHTASSRHFAARRKIQQRVNEYLSRDLPYKLLPD